MYTALPTVGAPLRASRRSTRRLAGGLAAATIAAAILTGVGTAPVSAAVTSSTDVVTTAPSTTSPLSWEPPALTEPTTVKVTSTNRSLKLDPTRDYVVQMPSTPVVGLYGLSITGGRNVVLIGGRVEIPVDALSVTGHAGRGLYLKNQTGTIHVEGLHITGPGLEEGINIDSRDAVVQLQNIRVDLVQGYAAGHHADVIQTWGGPRRLLVDGLTGSTQYQGMFLLPTQYGAPEPELFDLRRVDLRGTPESGYMIWRDSKAWPLTVRDVYVAPKNPLHRDSFLWPKGTGTGTAAWPFVQVGTPPTGEFVPAAAVGLGYRSPGYVTPETSEPSEPTDEVLQAVVVVNPAIGVLESVTPVPGGLRVTGWAADHDTTSPVLVDVSAAGTTGRVTTDVPRPDVAELNPGLPVTTGFDTVVPLPAGTHEVCVSAVNVGSGSDADLGCRTATVADTTAPVVSGPTLALRAGTVSTARVVPVTAAWSVTDDVAATEVRLTSPVTQTYAPEVTGAEHVVAAGTSTWTAEATDAAGNVGTASAEAVVTVVPETAATRYNYWWAPQSAHFLDGRSLRTNRSGAWMSHTFTGRSVAWVASTEAAGGLADVYVDGVLEATVDLASPTTVNRSVVFAREWGTPGTHTVKVVVRVSGGKVVTSDGFLTVD